MGKYVDLVRPLLPNMIIRSCVASKAPLCGLVMRIAIYIIAFVRWQRQRSYLLSALKAYRRLVLVGLES